MGASRTDNRLVTRPPTQASYPAMKRRGPLVSHATIALLVAACIASPNASPTSVVPTASPVTSHEPSPPTDPPTIAPVATMIPGCVGIDEVEPASPFFDATASLGHAGVDLQVTHIEERSGERRSVTPPPRDLQHGGRGLLLGGHEFLIHPSGYYEGHDTPNAMESSTVTLALDGRQPVELATRIVPGNKFYDQFAVAVPDIAGTGTISYEFAWTDRCFRLEASGAAAVEVVSLARTEGCALTEKAYARNLDALLDQALRVGGTRPRVIDPSSRARYAPFETIPTDAFIVYLFDEDQTAIAAAAGTPLRVEND